MKRTVEVHQPEVETVHLGGNDILTAENLLPGLQLRVAEIFG